MSTLSPASTYKSSLMELFQRSEAHEQNPQTGKVVKIVRNISIILLFMLVFGLIVWILWQLSNQQNKIHEFDVKLTEYQNISERMTNKNKEFADDIRPNWMMQNNSYSSQLLTAADRCKYIRVVMLTIPGGHRSVGQKVQRFEQTIGSWINDDREYAENLTKIEESIKRLAKFTPYQKYPSTSASKENLISVTKNQAISLDKGAITNSSWHFTHKGTDKNIILIPPKNWDSFCFYGFLIAKFNPNSLPDLNKTPEDRPTLTVSAKLHHDNQENFCKNITIQEKTFGDGMFDHGAWLKFSECWKKSQMPLSIQLVPNFEGEMWNLRFEIGVCEKNGKKVCAWKVNSCPTSPEVFFIYGYPTGYIFHHPT